MSYGLDSDLQGDKYQKTGGSESNYVKLPFDVPVVYWKHGDANAQPGPDGKMPITHYGRWNTSVDEWDQIVIESNLDIKPPEFEQRPKKDRAGHLLPGEFYRVYSWRYLMFSVIAQRSRWFPSKQADGSTRKMSHCQILAHLAEKQGKEIVPTLPVVLSAKVFASTHLEKLISQWFAFIDDLGPNVPAQYFYMAIGTFGDKSVFSGTRGTSTLPQLFVNDKLTKDTLPFVGNDIARKMSELKINAQEWLNDEAWLKPETVKSGSGGASSSHQPEEYAPDDDESIPF